MEKIFADYMMLSNVIAVLLLVPFGLVLSRNFHVPLFILYVVQIPAVLVAAIVGDFAMAPMEFAKLINTEFSRYAFGMVYSCFALLPFALIFSPLIVHLLRRTLLTAAPLNTVDAEA